VRAGIVGRSRPDVGAAYAALCRTDVVSSCGLWRTSGWFDPASRLHIILRETDACREHR
jgi:hypothetical protein